MLPLRTWVRFPGRVPIYNLIIEYFAPIIEKVHTEERSRLRALWLHGEIVQALKARDLARAEKAFEAYDRDWVKSF